MLKWQLFCSDWVWLDRADASVNCHYSIIIITIIVIIIVNIIVIITGYSYYIVIDLRA